MFSLLFSPKTMLVQSWPVDYKVPLHAIPRNVLAVLDGGGMLISESQRSSLLGALYHDATQYTL